MTRPKITPGPWHLGKRYGAEYGALYGPKGEEIALPLGFFMEPEEAKANAQAITAVPDLLDALELAEATLQRLAPDGSRATQGTRDVIMKALTKAGYTF